MAQTLDPPVILESGDRLTRAEFHRRYCARPDINKAELIEGVVYVQWRVPFFHGEAHAAMAGWLGYYAAGVEGVEVYDNTTVLLDADNEVRPEGSARLTEDDYIEGAPDLVVEIAASSASYDLHDKLRVYRRNGVPEYVVWRVLDKRMDWFRLREGVYVRLAPDARGVIASEVFPGLRLTLDRMLAGDRDGVLSAESWASSYPTQDSALSTQDRC